MLFFSLTIIESQTGTRRVHRIDESLIAAIANGDKNALAKLYELTKTAVFGFALSILRDRYDAEDILHDTYVTLYNAATEYRPMGKPMAWILTITRNLCLMKLRKDKRNESQPEDTWEPPDPRDRITSSTDRIVLETAMETLSDEERQIVMLHAVAGQKHREIALILDLPLSTTLSKYSRALSKLRNQLKEDVPHEKQTDY